MGVWLAILLFYCLTPQFLAFRAQRRPSLPPHSHLQSLTYSHPIHNPWADPSLLSLLCPCNTEVALKCSLKHRGSARECRDATPLPLRVTLPLRLKGRIVTLLTHCVYLFTLFYGGYSCGGFSSSGYVMYLFICYGFNGWI